MPFTARVAHFPDAFAIRDRFRDLPKLDPIYSAFSERRYERAELKGATIIDPEHGVMYECIAERRDGVPVLTRKTVIPLHSDDVASVAQISDARLAIITMEFVEDPEEWDMMTHLRGLLDEDGPDRWATPSPRKTRPALWRIAKIVNDALAAGEAPRQVLRDTQHISLPTADKWIKQARDAGLVAPAAGNRGRRPARTENQK